MSAQQQDEFSDLRVALRAMHSLLLQRGIYDRVQFRRQVEAITTHAHPVPLASESETGKVGVIIDAVARHWGVAPSDLAEPRLKFVKFYEPRCAAMYLLRRVAGLSLHQIGRRFNRAHTTTFHAIELVRGRLRQGDPALEKNLKAVCFLAGVKEPEEWI